MGRRALQAVLVVIGGVAVATSAATLLTGGALILGAGDLSPSADSELRFYSAWYLGAGAVILHSVPRVERAAWRIRFISLIFFVAGCARVLSLVTVGIPHPLALVLMGIELVMPAMLIPWQAAVARRAGDPGGPTPGEPPESGGRPGE